MVPPSQSGLYCTSTVSSKMSLKIFKLAKTALVVEHLNFHLAKSISVKHLLHLIPNILSQMRIDRIYTFQPVTFFVFTGKGLKINFSNFK